MILDQYLIALDDSSAMTKYQVNKDVKRNNQQKQFFDQRKSQKDLP